MATILTSIPSPGANTLELGPLTFNAYGLMIALGVMAAVLLSSKRLEARGGNPEVISSIALVAVPAGLVGARLYHVLTDWQRFRGNWGDVYKVWEGGLGIPGGMALGIVAGIWVAKRKGLDVPTLLDVVAPALPLAQAIGRVGNWFNQEIVGGPTDLPWALEIDEANRPAEFLNEPTFHPTFLYEALWNLALVAVLLRVDRSGKLKRGRLIWLYVFGYGLGRLWIEAIRSDEASIVLGLRVNIWLSLALIISGGIALMGARRDDSLEDKVTLEDEMAETDADEVVPDEADADV